MISVESLEKFNELITQTRENLDAIQEYIIGIASTEVIEKAPDEITFKTSLTQLEQAALLAIKDNINEKEGNISISKLVEDYNISRPVFTNLLHKMSAEGFAEVVNQGVKGTYIRLYK